MSKLQEFLNRSKSVKEITKKVVIGDRFKDEEGNYMPFKIKTVSSKKIEEIREAARTVTKKGKFTFNSNVFNNNLVIECCLEPNFKDTASINSRKVLTPEEYLEDVLLPGEIESLSNKIQALSGYNININDLIEEAKN